MSDESKPRRVDLDAAMWELYEAQRKIDEVAKHTVERIKRLVEVREHLVPGANATFDGLYGHWYRDTDRELTAAGFQSFGQYRNTNKPSETTPEKDAYLEFTRFSRHLG